jgi:hypothetical protein
MMRWAFAAFPLAIPFLSWVCRGKSRPDSSHSTHTFDNQIRRQLPSEGL